MPTKAGRFVSIGNEVP